MNMGIGINTQRPDEGRLPGKLEEIACGAWFTSGGATIPKMIKYQDEEGMIHSISRIHVHKQQQKYFCGIPIQEFCCSTVEEDREYRFRLYYYPQTHCWKISWEGGGG